MNRVSATENPSHNLNFGDFDHSKLSAMENHESVFRKKIENDRSSSMTSMGMELVKCLSEWADETSC